MSLDAKNEVLEIKFSPCTSNNATPLDSIGGPSQELVTALTSAVLGVPGLPDQERVTVS